MFDCGQGEIIEVPFPGMVTVSVAPVGLVELLAVMVLVSVGPP